MKFVSNENKLKASIIVPFRNEAHKLRRCVLSILQQNFERDRYEIILVDDNSNDDYLNSIYDLIEKEKIRLIKLENHSGKKRAIEKGISEAANEIIVTTDADCYHSKNWLKSLIETFDEQTGFVAGKVVYSKTKNLFEEFQKIEFASLVSIGSAFIGNNIPLLANGASCAYRKDLFFQVGGFQDNINLASGDEEFLMQKIHFDTEYEVKFCAARESVTFTEPIHSIKKFINQRKRWVSKVPFYRNKILLPVLSILYSFYVLFLISIIILIFNQSFFETIFQIFIVKNLIDFVFMIKGFHLLELTNKKSELFKLILLFPIAEIFHLIYISIVPVLSYLTGFNWKGRDFKR
ncbi:MAG: glycosyltransferase [Ignavibacteria bacterium]|nr:glycosyltransferase [Ignavibacteria bacterium]